MGLMSLLFLAAPCLNDGDCQAGQRCVESTCQALTEASADRAKTAAPSATPATQAASTTPSAPAPVAAPQPADNARYEFVLADGSRLVGRVVGYPAQGQLSVQLLDGTTRTLMAADVVSQRPFQAPKVGADGNLWEDNPNRTRHLYSPSAMQLKQGEGYVSVKEFLFLSGAYGVTDNVSVLVGTFIPTLFVFDDAGGLIGAIKVGTELSEGYHVAGGAEVITLPNFGDGGGLNLLGIGFAGFTVGQPDKQFTVNVGRPFALSGSQNELGDVLFTLSAQYRLTNRYGLITENWFFPTVEGVESSPILSFHALAFRQMRDRSAFDFGVIGISGVPGAFPWVDWTWNIEKPRHPQPKN